jgi:hypothetical protein
MFSPTTLTRGALMRSLIRYWGVVSPPYLVPLLLKFGPAIVIPPFNCYLLI